MIEKIYQLKCVLLHTEVECEFKYENKLKMAENAISLIKVEKLIYNALSKTDKNIFAILLTKYDTLMCDSQEFVRIMSESNEAPENIYLEFCNKTLDQRNFIKMVCDKGANLI
jgi:hypothetical protein